MSITLTHEQLVGIYSYPFPPEEGFIYDDIALLHWLELTTQPMSEAAEAGDGLRDRAVWSLTVTRAADALIQRALVESRMSAELEEAVPVVQKANAARVAAFADGLISSPPVCEPAPLPGPGVHVVIGGIVVILPSVQPPPVPLKEMSPYDLLAVATRFRAAAEMPDLAPVRAEFELAAERLLEVAQKQLG